MAPEWGPVLGNHGISFLQLRDKSPPTGELETTETYSLTVLGPESKVISAGGWGGGNQGPTPFGGSGGDPVLAFSGAW